MFILSFQKPNYMRRYFQLVIYGISMAGVVLGWTSCKNGPDLQAGQTGEAPAKDSTALKAGIAKSPYGVLPDGTTVDLYTLRNKKGMIVKITNYGGIITQWMAPDKDDKMEDVVLGFDSLGGYLKDSPYFGALVGRYGNRIAKGRFKLNGKTYHLAVNNIGNHLHGGLKGFDKVVWKAESADSIPTLKLTYRSKDGEEGYPGNLDVTVLYELRADNALSITYSAVSDQATPVNLTNHTYFNLTGGAKRDILDHQLILHADQFLPVDKTLIPTGVLKPVEGTIFDFRKQTAMGAHIDDTLNEQIKFGGGYDHCWVLTAPVEPLKTDSAVLKQAASVYEPISGRTLETLTTEPAIQFYTGNFLDGKLTGKNGVVYKKRYAFCLETEHFPDSPNQPNFPSTILKPGEVYRSQTIYRFAAVK